MQERDLDFMPQCIDIYRDLYFFISLCGFCFCLCAVSRKNKEERKNDDMWTDGQKRIEEKKKNSKSFFWTFVCFHYDLSMQIFCEYHF